MLIWAMCGFLRAEAAVFKVMAMNRVYKGITSPPAEWQIEVQSQSHDATVENSFEV